MSRVNKRPPTRVAHAPSPFRIPSAPTLAPRKFQDPSTTADGAPRARVGFERLETLWFNTGTLCNIACATCYIESSPRNDALAYLSAGEVRAFLDEIRGLGAGLPEIGFTGGEPFMNRDIIPMLEAALGQGHRCLVLTNAMRPMRRWGTALLGLKARYGGRLTLRVSLDHYTRQAHEAERGPDTWTPAIEGLQWLSSLGFSIAVAGRRLPGESEATARRGYADLFAPLRLGLSAEDPARLALFPELDAAADVPEISEACWGLLGVSPSAMMCATSRMIVKRRGAASPVVVACTLTPYDPQFEVGATLSQAFAPVRLNHPHCARFCVLGGASCSAAT